MALWRDPLAELIGELERTLPPEVGSHLRDILPPLADVHFTIHECLKGGEAWARAQKDPRVQAVLTHFARVGQLQSAEIDRSDKS